MRRVLVVGMSGAGKTTVARRLAGALGTPFHEMDALALGPGFSRRPELLDDVHRVTGADAWVVDSWAIPRCATGCGGAPTPWSGWTTRSPSCSSVCCAGPSGGR